MIRKRICAVIMGIIMLSVSVLINAKTYPDVPRSSKAFEAVGYLSEIGVVEGYEDGNFLPEKEITRGEATALLARTLGYNDDYIAKEMPFEDVKSGYWAERFISFCWEMGLVNGMTENIFNPADKVTYAQMVKMLVCASDLSDSVGRPTGVEWYQPYIDVADEHGVTENVDVVPNANAPREDVVVLVYNCIKEGLVNIEKEDEEEEKSDESENETDEPSEDDEKNDDSLEKEEEVDPDKDLSPEEYKEKYTKTVDIPKNYKFAKGIEYDPLFDEDDVDFDGLKKVSRKDSLLIAIDPGHNFSQVDVGAHNEEYDVWEQNITWPIAQMLRMKLEYMGFDVIMTRDNINDVIVGETVKDVLLKRAGIANKYNADLYISIHCNAGGGKGVETYCFVNGTEGERLAKTVQKQLVKGTELYDRGVKTASFVVLKETVMPAILVETAFIDRTDEVEFLISVDGQNKLSSAIAKGVYDYVTD